MRTYKRAYIHACIHNTHIRTYVHIHTLNTYIHTYIHTYTHTYTHTQSKVSHIRAIKTHRGVETEFHLFGRSALDACEWPGSQPGCFTPKKVPPVPVVHTDVQTKQIETVKGKAQASKATEFVHVTKYRLLQFNQKTIV
jgi:hypothetical protein